MSIEGQVHFLILTQGRVHTKIQTRFSQKLLCRSKPGVGPYVVLCDFCAKIDFLLNSIETGVLCTKNHGVQIFQAPGPNLGSHFLKLAVEPI